MNRPAKKSTWMAVAVGAGLLAFFVLRGCDRTPAASPSAPLTRVAPALPPAATSARPAPGATSSAPRLQALTFVIDRNGLHLERSALLPGRVKIPPRSVAADRLEFRVLAADGRELYAGSIDHPLHRRLEFESATQPGRLEQTAADAAANVFALRLPAELAAARVSFFEVRAGAATPAPLGEILLP